MRRGGGGLSLAASAFLQSHLNTALPTGVAGLQTPRAFRRTLYGARNRDSRWGFAGLGAELH